MGVSCPSRHRDRRGVRCSCSRLGGRNPVFGLVAGAVFAYFYLIGDRGKPPARLAPLRRRHLLSRYALLVGLVYALTGGVVCAVFGLAIRLGAGQIVALATGVGIRDGLAGALTAGLSRSAADDSRAPHPARFLAARSGVRARRGPTARLRSLPRRRSRHRFRLCVRPREHAHGGAGEGTRAGVCVAAGVRARVRAPCSPRTWTASLTFAQLAMRWHTPVRLLRFLDDARERDVLRTVGPIYQFRHARLQDRLAQQATPNELPRDVPIP